MKYRYTDEELILAVQKSKSIANVCRELNIRAVGGNYKTIKNKIKNLNIDTSHFTWQGWNIGLKHKFHKPIPLELHHINGVNTDNRIENIQLLCPNCHASTDTYRGKNLQSAISEKREVEYRKFREALTDNADGNPEQSSS